MKQTKFKCIGKYSHECKPDKCSIDKTSCYFLNSLASTLRANSSRFNKAYHLKKFKDFTSRIRNCSQPKYELKTAEFCENKSICLAIDYNVITQLNENKITYCPCRGKLSFKCNVHLCSVDKRACDQFNRRSNMLKKINKCVSKTE